MGLAFAAVIGIPAASFTPASDAACQSYNVGTIAIQYGTYFGQRLNPDWVIFTQQGDCGCATPANLRKRLLMFYSMNNSVLHYILSNS
jgi:hypothetical protein